MLFVLGVMLLLLAVGVSTLAAAGASSGFALSQRNYSRIMLLGDSVHKNILYSLQNDPSDDSLLAYQLARALYAAYETDSGAGLESMELVLSFDAPELSEKYNNGDIYVESITLAFPRQEVTVRPAKPAVTDEDGGLLAPREPKTATVNAVMTVMVEVAAGKRTVRTVATYRYSGGALNDDPLETGTGGEMVFLPDDGNGGGFGKWELVKYEKLDS